MNITYAIYDSQFLKDKNISPEIRSYSFEDAKEIFGNSTSHILVTEVGETDSKGRLIIKEYRVIDAPQLWIPFAHKPEYDGSYLCHVVRKEECGNFIRFQQVILCAMNEWSLPKDWRITHWMIVKEPEETLKLTNNPW